MLCCGRFARLNSVSCQSQVSITSGGNADVRSRRVSSVGSIARRSANVFATSAPGSSLPP